jgi:hypothetical protein
MTNPRAIAPDTLRALLLQGRMWLCAMLLWLADVFGDTPLGERLRAEIEGELLRLRRGVRAVLVCIACVDRPLRTTSPGSWRPVGAPPGFRRQSRGAWLRHVTRVTRWRGRNLRGHFTALRAVIDGVDALAPRVRRRVDRHPQRAPVMAWVGAAPCASLARVVAPVADSS